MCSSASSIDITCKLIQLKTMQWSTPWIKSSIPVYNTFSFPAWVYLKQLKTTFITFSFNWHPPSPWSDEFKTYLSFQSPNRCMNTRPSSHDHYKENINLVCNVRLNCNFNAFILVNLLWKFQCAKFFNIKGNSVHVRMSSSTRDLSNYHSFLTMKVFNSYRLLLIGYVFFFHSCIHTHCINLKVECSSIVVFGTQVCLLTNHATYAGTPNTCTAIFTIHV